MLQMAEQSFSPAETSSFGKFDSKLVKRGVEHPSAAHTPPSLSLLILESTCGRSFPSCMHKKGIVGYRKKGRSEFRNTRETNHATFSVSSGSVPDIYLQPFAYQ